jgi:hypothetical protein
LASSEESVDIQELHNTLYTTPSLAVAVNSYNQLPRVKVRLSSLRSTYLRQDHKTALARLYQRSVLEIDQEYVIEMDDPNYCMSCSNSFLDYILVVGSNIGLDVFIPNVLTDPTFSIRLNLRLHLKQFTAKYGTLGFDPTGAMLCIAQTPTEDLWIGMAPDRYFCGTEPPFQLAEKYGSTQLSTKHLQMLRIFICHVLSLIQSRNYYLFKTYEISLTHTAELELETNVL